jgi:hypothetical protein|tara:strand:+ start:186 stop:473 length:288 start_codon:yes stop_codon:yes gene_type:complete
MRRLGAFLFHGFYRDLSIPFRVGFGTFKKDSKVAVRVIGPNPYPHLSIALKLILLLNFYICNLPLPVLFVKGYLGFEEYLVLLLSFPINYIFTLL